MIGAGAVAFALMGYIISHQERDREIGWVIRLNPVLLATILGEKPEDVDAGIKFLCSPDNDSTSKLEGGKRIVPLAPGSMEYRVVNGDKYQEIREYEDRKEQNREAQARWRNKQKANGGAGAPISDADFETFWSAYPRKVGRVSALKAWKRDGRPELSVLIAALEKWKGTDQWQKDGGKFVPYPASWLNGKRWEDEMLAGEEPLPRVHPGMTKEEEKRILRECIE